MEAKQKTNGKLHLINARGGVPIRVVLLVDDEVLLRTTIEKILSLRGQNVLSASDGREALQIFSEHFDKIDVVITDMMMPGMDGVEFIHELRKLNRCIPIILTSGLGVNQERFALVRDLVTEVLDKPYEIKALQAAIRNATDGYVRISATGE